MCWACPPSRSLQSGLWLSFPAILWPPNSHFHRTTSLEPVLLTLNSFILLSSPRFALSAPSCMSTRSSRDSPCFSLPRGLDMYRLPSRWFHLLSPLPPTRYARLTASLRHSVVVVQSLSHVRLRDPVDCSASSLSSTVPRNLLRFMSVELMTPSNHLCI